MDKISAYRTFRGVVEQGSFAGAARHLGLSNAAVSKNVKELEQSVGVQLIMRTTRKMSVTEAGDLYYDHICKILDNIAEADEAVTEMSGEPRGTLKLTAPVSLGLIMVTPLVAAFRREFPKVEISLDLTDEKVDLFERGLDLAIRGGGTLPDSSLRARKLSNLDRIVCASPEYLAAKPDINDPSDLSAHDCLLYSRWDRQDRWEFTRKQASRTVQVSGGYTVNNSMAIRQAVLEGAGVALIPKIMVAGDLDEGTLIDVLPAWKPEQQAIYALYPDSAHMVKRVRVFIDFLVGNLSSTK